MGLCQGDPLSPLLFDFVMEALSLLNSRAASGGFLNGFSVNGHCRVHNITHLFYVDDTLIMCDANQNQLRYLRCTLLQFETVSRLRISLGKSEMVLVGKIQTCKI